LSKRGGHLKIIGIGDNVVDYYEHQGLMYPGGNALNVPVMCNRIGATQSSYIGILGTDLAGKHVLESLKLEGIDVSHVRQVMGPNGEATVSLREGDRVFVGSTGGVQDLLTIRLSNDDLAFIREHDLLHTSVYSHIEGELKNIALDISFDFSTRRDAAYLGRVCPLISLAFFSGSDLASDECSSLMKQVSSYGVETVVITRGADGALCWQDGQTFSQPAVAVTQLVDTLGAGDAFIAGFLTARAEQRDIPACLRMAAETAAETCAYFGAFGRPLAKVTEQR